MRRPGRVDYGKINGILQVIRLQVSGVCPFHDYDPGILPQFPGQLAVTDVNSIDPVCTIL